MNRLYEQIIPRRTVIIEPDGSKFLSLDYGKQGVTTVRLIPPKDDSEQDRQEGHARVQKVLNYISDNIKRDMTAQKTAERKEEYI
jgi:hypothetical protein